MDSVKLTATAHTVLGLLSFGQALSGYEIRQWARRSIGHLYTTPAQSQVYGELRRLESAGLVAGTPVTQDDRPDKVVYELTDAGADALHDWVADPEVPETALKHHVALRVFLGHVVDPVRLVPMLEAHRDRLLVSLDELETYSVAMSGDPTGGFSALVADWIADLQRGDLAGVERALKALTQTDGSG
ncbi:MAG: PadR family transcriptional regulator [Actinomycetota bacterium]